MNCFSCKSELVSATSDPDTQYQFDNALWISFDGGYGMFIDPVDHELAGSPNPFVVVICHECSHDLCNIVPWICDLLQPHLSHSHTSECHETHPDHKGWDYDVTVTEE